MSRLLVSDLSTTYDLRNFPVKSHFLELYCSKREPSINLPSGPAGKSTCWQAMARGDKAYSCETFETSEWRTAMFLVMLLVRSTEYVGTRLKQKSGFLVLRPARLFLLCAFE